jgi:Ca2+-binding RTX toxin-like protein
MSCLGNTVAKLKFISSKGPEMANVDLSKWKTGGVVSRSGLEIEALANFEANDLSSVSITNKEFSFSGLTRYKGKSFSTTYTLRGSFDLSDQDRWLIKSIRITMDAYGEISISGLSLGGDALANGSLDHQFLAGNDTIIGSPYADRLNGDSGKDRLTGGGGVDVFVYTAINHSMPGGSKRDVITDFRATSGEKIDLSAIDAYTNTPGNQTFAYIGSRAFTGKRGEVRFSAGLLQVNTGTDRSADMEIQLAGVGAIGVSSLIL